MQTIETPDVYGYTTFCDDIRIEADGKWTLVGTYQNHMFVAGVFPVTLPKFGLSVTLLQRRPHFAPDTKIMVWMPGDPEETASIQAEMGESTPGAVLQGIDQQDPTTDGPYVVLRANFILAPFTISQAGQIRVRAVHRDKLIRLGALQVLSKPNG
jgi:hypothetical protein